MEDRRGAKLALVGLSGAGKTTLGGLLAAELGWPFHDLDRRIVTAQDQSVAAIFAAEGESGFREYETAELIRVTSIAAPWVLATGGGVVLDPANRRLLENECLVVWLSVDPEEAARRLAPTSDRPLLSPEDATADLRRLLTEREAWYAEVADTVFDTGSQPLEDAAPGLARILREQHNLK